MLNMKHEPVVRMHKLIIAGTYAQYRDWLVQHGASSRAAVFIDNEDKLRGCDPECDEIVLVGTYWDNPAYQSAQYLYLTNTRLMALAS
jgi:hypothetical protein